MCELAVQEPYVQSRHFHRRLPHSRRCDGCAALADLLPVSEEPSGMTTPL